MSFISGAGNTNVDLLYQGMERLPNVGEELYAKDFSLQLGGGLPAVLINLSRLGIETRIATELGSDIFSEFAKKEFEKNCVTPFNLYNGDKIPLTITSAIILPKDRSFFSYGKGMVVDRNSEEEFYNMAAGSKLCMMQTDGFNEVYKRLKAEGTTLVLDTGWDDSMSMEAYADYLELADYYTPNRKEALKITGAQNEADAAQILSKYLDRVVVKLDADGCIGLDENGYFFSPSIADFKCVDSTGAGDAFLAGFMYGLFRDFPFQACIEFGNITGGKAVTEVGALSGYVSEAELMELHRKYYE